MGVPARRQSRRAECQRLEGPCMAYAMDDLARFSLQTLRVVRDGHVLIVSLDRPQRRNALNRRACDEIEQVFRAVRSDGLTRCVVVTGCDPAFCAGEDVKEMMAGQEAVAARARLAAIRPEPTPAAVAVLECERPVIAAINGAAAGWGLELALYADIRIASERAAMGEIFVKRGLVSDVGGVWLLPLIVGREAAAELLFTGDVIDAARALEIRLVSRVVAHADLMPTALALAHRIATNPPLALAALKEGLRVGRREDLREVGAWVSGTLAKLFATEDHRERVASFLEKRAPVFHGR